MSDSERRMAEARQILANPLYREAYQTIRERLIGQLESFELEPSRRQRINDLLVALAKVNKYMEQVVVTGELDAIEEQRKLTMRERLHRFVA